jgi:hypothetical protein
MLVATSHDARIRRAKRTRALTFVNTSCRVLSGALVTSYVREVVLLRLLYHAEWVDATDKCYILGYEAIAARVAAFVNVSGENCARTEENTHLRICSPQACSLSHPEPDLSCVRVQRPSPRG